VWAGRYLSIGALGIGGILKGVEDFLESYNCFGLLIDGLPNNSVGSLA
jgi:hypothetical protein